jgi:hypothetical protein
MLSLLIKAALMNTFLIINLIISCISCTEATTSEELNHWQVHEDKNTYTRSKSVIKTEESRNFFDKMGDLLIIAFLVCILFLWEICLLLRDFVLKIFGLFTGNQ